MAVHEGFISVTPLHVDLTNYRTLQEMRDLRLPWH
jgi:broad specificity polyphosphatase/5'/3'-nucleotidase SurE